MAGSANPTDEEFYENLQYNVGRISAAQKEILRRLEVNMPGKIAYLNGILYPAGKGIPEPKNYLVAPAASLSDEYINCILCGVTVSTSANGAGQFKNVAQIVIYSVDRRIEDATQVEDALDRAGVAIGILLKFLNGCHDEEGRRVWRSFEPTGHTLTLPQSWAETYSGSTACFTLVQDQSCNCWT